MAVFPASSRKHVPEPWQHLMTDKNSPIIDFYPDDFQVDLNGKKYAWQGVVLLPYVDEHLLKKTLNDEYERLSPDEKKRNMPSNERLFVGKDHKLYEFFKNVYSQEELLDIDTSFSGGIAGKIWRDECAVQENEVYTSPLCLGYQAIANNKVISVKYHNPLYNDDHVFKASVLDVSLEF